MEKKNTKLILLLCLFWGSVLPLKAQTVSGTVKDAQTGKTLPGVNISVKGTQQGTSTNAQGHYTLSVPSRSDTLVFSYIGYHAQTVPIKGRTTIDVNLKQSINKLNSMVVIGYGTQKKQDETGSVTSVSSSDFNQGSITSPQDLLTGKTAGVTVTPNGGAPGSGATVRIRGGSSLSASNAPLYVVDGMPLEGSGVSGTRNPLNTINPNDIKSITILKDASATAIYGSRASNGVIIITTKKGQEGEPLKVNYTGKFSLNTNANQVNVLSTKAYKRIISQHFGQRGVTKFGDASTNWQNQIYRNSFSQQHNLSFTGSYKELPYRVSLGFTGNNGTLKTSKMNRQTASISLNPSLLNDKLKIDLNLKGARITNRFANQGAIGAAVAFDPTHPVKVDTAGAPFGGYYTWVSNEGIPNNTTAPANPVALLKQTHDNSTVYRSIGNIKFDYQLPYIPDLHANLNLGYDYSTVGKGRYVVPANAAFAITGNGAPGTRRDYSQDKRNQTLNFYLSYDKDLSNIKSHIKATAGYSWEHHYSQGSTYETNYNRADTLVVNQNTSYKTEHYIISFFGRFNYSFENKYLLTGTLRDDGTSRFSKSNRWGLFPSAAFAWKINQEPFLKKSNIVSQMKLRLSYGITGQQRINQGDYPYLGTYTYSQPNADYQFGNNFVTTLRPEGYNSNIKWESTTTYDVGLDYGFFNDRLNGSFDAYYRKTNNLLNVIPVPAGTNFTNRILTNVGTLDVRGFEFDVTGRPISTDNGYLQISFNASHNINKITKLTNVNNPEYIGVETGGISGGTGNTIQINSVGHPRKSFYVYKQVYNQNGRPLAGVYVDQNGDGIINANDKYRYKSPSPRYTFGLSPKAKYKNWDFSFTARADLGNYVYNNVLSNHDSYNSLLNSSGVLTNAVASITQTNFSTPQYHSDYFVENASFLRLDNATLGYTFKQLGFEGQNASLRLSATVQNAFVITNYDGINPEVFGGIDNNIYPRPRTFILGISLNF
ncbi:MAG TPA: SusC/RagA family TonB-linked outer membrane protein [Balneolaceae bacterium]|nr:SusC/RagA family TonB-linked outer membrane protein [Balneolaceae bacterium]